MTRQNRRFRFAVQAGRTPTADGWLALAREAESLGYATLCMPDHFGDQFAPGPALAAAAAATRTLLIGTLVSANDFRHPVVLAKEAATLDVLSGGRLELGMGAGWEATDYERSGIPCDPPGRRIERLAESVRIVKGLMADEPCTFAGEHYRVTALQGQPRPVQRPHPPLLIGGGGRRILSLAAREANIVGIGANLRSGSIGPHMVTDVLAGQTDRKVAWVREAAGDRFDEIELQMQIPVLNLNGNREQVAAAIAQVMQTSTEDVLEAPLAVLGTVQQAIDQLERQRERYGVSYASVQATDMHAFAPIVERLAGT